MNRRPFLLALPFVPVAVAAVVKLVAKESEPLTLDSLIDELDRIKREHATREPADFFWFQTTRMSCARTLAYEDALDAILEPDPVKRKCAWHQRRRERFTRSLAFQRALPTPHLP